MTVFPNEWWWPVSYWLYGLNALIIFQVLNWNDFITFLNISIKPGLQVDTIFPYLILLFMLVLQFSKWKKKHCASINQSWTNGRWKEFLFVRISVKYPKITLSRWRTSSTTHFFGFSRDRWSLLFLNKQVFLFYCYFRFFARQKRFFPKIVLSDDSDRWLGEEGRIVQLGHSNDAVWWCGKRVVEGASWLTTISEMMP